MDETKANDKNEIKKPVWGNINPRTVKNCNNNYDGSVTRQGNTIYFYADVAIESVQLLNMFLEEISRENMLKMYSDGADMPSPCFLNIESMGGGLYAGLAAYNKIKSIQIPVITVINGAAASAASLLFLAGDDKQMSKYSYMMIHQLSTCHWGTFENLKDDFANSKQLMETLITIYKDNTKIPRKKIEEMLKRDLFMSADECLKNGIATRII